MDIEPLETSHTEEDDCCENIPPGPPCTRSASASTNDKGKVKLQLPNVPSALTPFLKYMNIGSRCDSSKLLKCGSNPLQDIPRFPLGAGSTNTTSYCLYDETLPDITFLDETCDMCSPTDGHQCANRNSPLPKISTALKTTTENGPKAPPELSQREERLSWLDVKNFPEISLLDVTHDNHSPQAAQTSSSNSNQDTQVNNSTLKLSGQTEPQPGQSTMTQSEDLSGLSVHSEKNVEETATKKSLEGTQDISLGSLLENSKSALEPRGETFEKIETLSSESTSCSHPANVTFDGSSSSGNVSAQDQQLSTSDMKCNSTSSATKKPPSPNIEGAANNTITLSQTSNGTITLLQPDLSLSNAAPMSPRRNNTIDLPQPDVMSPELKSDAADQTSSVSTETSPIKNPIGSASKESDSSDVPHISTESQSPQKSSGSTAVEATVDLQNNTIECEKPPTENVSVSLSESSSADCRQKTMDKHSPQVCDQTSSLKEGAPEAQPPEHATNPNAGDAGNREGTFEVDPALDTSSAAAQHESKDHSKSVLAMIDSSNISVSHQNLITETNKAGTFNLDDTLDLKVESLVTSTPIVSCKMFSGSPRHEKDRIPGAQKKLMSEDPVRPAAQATSEVPPNLVCDRKTFLKQPTNIAKPRLPPPKLVSQLMKNKAASALPMPFGLPMTRQRTQIEASRNAAASDAQTTTGTSSSYNLRATTSGLKLPGSGLQRPQLSGTGIPSGVQRIAPGLKMPPARGNTQAPEKVCGPAAVPSSAAGSSAACDAASGVRSLKQPANNQRTVTAKSQARATNLVPKTSQLKKHPLPRHEAVPSSKKLKMDAVSSSSSESLASHQRDRCKDQTRDAAVPSSASGSSAAADAASRARALKHPAKSQRALTAKPQAHGCSNCALLEKQNKVMAEEIKRLNEELLKCKQNEDRN